MSERSNVVEIHYSEIADRLRCERLHFNKYRRQIFPVGPPSENMVLGRLWHKMIQVKHKEGRQAAVDLWEAETGGVGLAVGDYRWLPAMLDKYSEWYAASAYRVLLSERELRVPYAHGLPVDVVVVLVGSIDRLYLDSDGQYWIGEDKTTAQFGNRHLLMDKQGLTYTLLADELGLPVQGMLYVQAKKHNPLDPRTRTDTVKSYPIPFSEDAVGRWAEMLDIVLPQIILERMEAIEKVEPRMLRRFNPLPWMGCFCDYESECLGWLNKRDVSELYEWRAKVRDDAREE